MVFLQFDPDSLDFVELEALALERAPLSKELVYSARQFVRDALPLDSPEDISHMSVLRGSQACPGSLTVLWERPAVLSQHGERDRGILKSIRDISLDTLLSYSLAYVTLYSLYDWQSPPAFLTSSFDEIFRLNGRTLPRRSDELAALQHFGNSQPTASDYCSSLSSTSLDTQIEMTEYTCITAQSERTDQATVCTECRGHVASLHARGKLLQTSLHLLGRAIAQLSTPSDSISDAPGSGWKRTKKWKLRGPTYDMPVRGIREATVLNMAAAAFAREWKKP
ncbi:hypothetical protein K488DRAFT_81550 [Vararia minispora EC-137]|uniref:Uncharacterized protein n=1 Tax=Vararia minispora EC-137 TaxID=1314806 RepID=A0ACB8QZG7_9AGAM|nr:hypothetical protein K488DRAFT_81550 [Vararia minispora EC-137]